jgi:hypothetical protein
MPNLNTKNKTEFCKLIAKPITKKPGLNYASAFHDLTQDQITRLTKAQSLAPGYQGKA